MIELTDEQRQAILEGKAIRVRENGNEYVLLHPTVYERLSEEEYDDDPWTSEDMDRLREEATEMLDQFGKDK